MGKDNTKGIPSEAGRYISTEKYGHWISLFMPGNIYGPNSKGSVQRNMEKEARRKNAR